MAQKAYPNVRIGWTKDLPFSLDSKATKERYEYYKDKMNEAILVTVFGTDKFDMLGERTIVRTKIYNDKINQWQEYDCRFYYGICPICGKLMKVVFIPGTTWLVACSRECYGEMDQIRTSSTKPEEAGNA